MKWTLACLALATLNAQAYSCPQNMSEKQSALKSWLDPLRGIHELKNCRIEITVCQGEEPDVNGAVVGEVYVVDAKGREAYLPLSISESEKIQARVRVYPRLLYYLKKDKYSEDEFGRTEAYRLEMRLKNGALTGLDLGTYATNKRLHRIDGSESRWYNCGD